MRGRSVDCEVDLTATACVRELPKLDLFAAWTSLAPGLKLVGEDVGDEIFGEGQRQDPICLVLLEVQLLVSHVLVHQLQRRRAEGELVGREVKVVERFQACLRLRQGQAFRWEIGSIAKTQLDIDWGGEMLGLTGIEMGLILSGDRKG